MSLDSRSKSLFKIKNSLGFDEVTALIISKNLSNNLYYKKLKISVQNYIFRSLFILKENNFINEINDNYYEYKNITPNGSLAPKSEFEVEYNALVSSYVDFIVSLGLNDFIIKHHFPIHVRIKKYKTSDPNNLRPHATELVHSDAWAGESSDSVNLHIPLFGDIENNHMKFFMPPPSFKTEWLKHLDNYSQGESIARLYSPVDFKYDQDTLIISDLATLHKSYVKPSSQIRISLDTTFLNLKDSTHNETVFIHPNRNNEMISFDLFKTFGKSNVLRFTNSLYDPIKEGSSFSVGYNWLTK
jgi:hypothetical protein